MGANAAALLDRWRAFLDKIHARLGELMTEADLGLKGLMVTHPDDAQPLGNALTGLDYRVSELRTRIQQTWDTQVDDQFQEAGDHRAWDAAIDLKRDQELAFDQRWDKWKIHAVADFYRNLWPLAEAAIKKPVPCIRCRSPLQLPRVGEVTTVSCAYCHAVNQVVPDKAALTYFGGAPHAFAEEAAMERRHEVLNFRAQVDQQRRRATTWVTESLESLLEWERKERAYWETYAAVKGQMLGQPPDRELVESRMAMFRKCNLETSQTWRNAQRHRPPAPH